MLAITSGSAFAQEQDDEAKSLAIEEVIVTAQRREQNLQDVPIAITAFDSTTIEKAMFADISDYVTSAPNASVISNGARSRRQISIRGVTNFLGHESPNGTTGFYVDDFSVANSTINPPIFDIEQIEILRGPQATYFGRNAIGGGISIITKKPTNVFEGSALVDYSSFNTLDVEGVLNTPLIEDTLAMRFNVKSTTSDGYIKNINPIGGGNDSDYGYAKGAVRWTPNEDLTIDASFQYTEEEVGMREGVASGVFSLFAGNVLYAGQFPDRNGDGKSDPFIDTVGFYPQNRDRTNFGSPQSIGTNMRNGVIRADYTTGNLLFTNITGYINSDFFLAGDIDGTSLDFFNEFRNLNRQSVSTEFR
ncbi:MAG TPA: TonB-dependent receptor plug domain-containing protein, partial [Xanthomonadales bacterium]|nr:TonB-dependent receptor plug domain-containing protein [Xanthomonadales bacterium]